MVKTVKEYLEEVEKIYDLWEGEKKHLFFRGHSNFEYQLYPNVLREKGYNEKEIFLDFKQYSPQHNMNYDFDEERDKVLADMQHYGIPTRLLDWTFAPLNALFFACEKNLDKDGEVIILNPWKYWRSIVKNKKRHDIHKIHIISRALISSNMDLAEIQNFIKKQFNYKKLAYEDIKKPFAFVANYTNDRIFHQRGCFTIHGLDNSSLDNYAERISCIKRIKIEANAKDDILDSLNKLYINEYSIYPDFEGMKKLIARRGGLFNTGSIK